MSPAEICVYVS